MAQTPTALRYVVAGIVLLTLVILIGLTFGSTNVQLSSLLSFITSITPETDAVIIADLRLPRVLFGGLVGATLAVTGTVFQAILKNPLAEPYILGVSGGAALGGTLFLALVQAWLISVPTWLSIMGLPMASLAGAAAVIVALFVYLRGAPELHSTTHMILVGVVINMFAGACITFIQATVSAHQAQTILFFLMGSLDVSSYSTGALTAAGLAMTTAILYLFLGSRELNLLSLGDEEATTLGVDLRQVVLRTVIAASAAVAIAVAYTGIIGFVGLIVPHALRKRIGPNHFWLIPASALYGATFLLTCDVVARSSFGLLKMTLPIGATTALVGGPVFILLLRSIRL